MERILSYNSLNAISLNWVILSGIAAGTLFCYRYFALKKWTYKTMTIIGYFMFLAYLILFYFSIGY